MKQELLNKIKEQGGVGYPYNNNVFVTIEDFFEGNDVKGSFATNGCTQEIYVHEFYNIFKGIKSKANVQDIRLLIYSVEEDWAYSDTAYILSSANKEEIYSWFGEAFPSDIGEDNPSDKDLERLPQLNDGYKIYYLWWD